MNRKECLKYYFSVEGETEKWYLEWLQEQINASKKAEYHVSFVIKIEKNPKKMVKKTTVCGDIKMIHVFDFEEIQNENAFKRTLVVMNEASKMKTNIEYYLGYSNYSFELWMILHKECTRGSKTHRSNYLSDINRCYGMQFESMKEFKEEANFKKVLERLSLEDVFTAIKNADKIMDPSMRDDKKISHCGYEYYRKNPSLNLHDSIQGILRDIELL